MTIQRATVTRAAAILLCSFLILATWAQSHRSKPTSRSAARTEANTPPSSSPILTLNSSLDATPSLGISGVVTGDFNGDGFPDIAVVNPCNQAIAACPGSGTSGWIAVMLGNGSGGFNAPVLYSSGTLSPNSLAIGDFNRDGHLDLAFTSLCVNYTTCGTGAVSVMLGRGDGTFQTPVAYASIGSQTSAVAVADFNGDGIPDLAVADLTAADHAGGSISVLIGHGDGTFAAPAAIGSEGAFAVSLAAGDFNGDGINDLAVVNVGGLSALGEVVVMLGHGDGTFQPGVSYGTGGYVPGNVVVSDLNQDGVPDLAVVNACSTAACSIGGAVGILLGNGDGSFRAPSSYATGGADSAFIAGCDFNGDGVPDLAVANQSPGSVTMLLGNGNGSVQSAVSFAPGGTRTVALAMADFNGDGQPDLAVANQVSSDNPSTASSVGVLLNTSTSFLQHADSVAVTSSANPAAPGQSVLLTASVSSTSRSGGIGGTLTFYDGSTALSTVNVMRGTATLTTSFATAAVHPIRAAYLGSPSYAPKSSPIFRQIVGSQVSLTGSPNPSALAQTVTLTASVGSGATGSVTFMDGSNALGTVPVVSGLATVSNSTLAAGTHSLTASYSGNLAPGTASLSQGVLITNTVQLSASAEVVLVNAPVTFTATVANESGVTPTGNLVFIQGTEYMADVPLTNGQAVFTTSFPAPSAYAIKAFYLGDALNQSSASAVLKQGVAPSLPVPSKIALSSSTATSVALQPITFTADVSSYYGSIPNGETVTFSDGSNPIGTAVTAKGVAVLTTPALAVGAHNITATYAGDSTFQPITSTAVSETVTGQPIATALTSSPNPAYVGQTVNFSVAIKSKYGSVPDGETITFLNGSNQIGTSLTSAGTATLSTSFPAAGAQSITLSYPGDANFLPHVSVPFTQTVSLSPTTTVVTSTLNPAFTAETLTLTATTSATFGTVPDGETITFHDGTNVIGTGTTAGGVATLSLAFSSVGTHLVTAGYSGDNNLAHSTSAAVKLLVKGSPTSTVLVTSLTPAYIAQGVTLTATVTPKYGVIPDGETVTFDDGATGIGTALTSSGVATLNTSFATAATHMITAVYAGDATLLTSTSAAIKQLVKINPTTATLTSNTNPAFVGQSLTLTATVAAQFGAVPDGETVTFKKGTAVVGTGLTSGGVASLTTSFPAAGNLSLTALYPGDAALPPATSTAVAQVVQKSATTTTMVSSLNPAYDQQSITFTATIATQFGAIPDGETITFDDGSKPLGTGTTASGVATLTFAFKTAANHFITALYAGDTANSASTSGAIKQVIQADTTTTTLTSSVNPAYVGQPVTFTATVTPLLGPVPDGETITFNNGTTAIGTATTVSGVAKLTMPFATPAAMSVTASYPGDAMLSPSASSAINQIVKKSPTTTMLTSSANPVFIGQPVTFTATITAQSGSPIPDGETVTFANGKTSLGTATTMAGVATLTMTFKSPATDSITASYPGDAAFAVSTSTALSQVIKSNASTTTLVSSLNPAYVGQQITLTATVTSPGGFIPDGETVTFTAGSTALGTALTVGGVATFMTSSLAAGTYSIVASYPGDGTYIPSASAALSQVVKKSATTTALTSSANPSVVSQPVTLTATITASFGSVPDGETVTFKNGTAVLGTGLTASGAATLNTTFTVVASDTLTATYSGDLAFIGSTSAKLTQVVNTNTTTTALSSSQNPSVISQPVTFTAAITPVYGTVPDGETVTFKSGTATLGTALTASGVATLNTSFAFAGSKSITASYPGDTTFQPSVSIIVTQVVNANTTTNVLTSSLNPSFAGQAVTFAASIAPVYGSVPNGETVTFYNGSIVLGTATTSNGGASYTTSSLAVGSYNVTASYPGDKVFSTSTSNAVAQVVNINQTTVGLVSSANPGVSGRPVVFTATVASTGPVPTGTVTFFNGTTAMGSPRLNSGGVATLSTSNLTPGSYTITAQYNGDAKSAGSVSSALTQAMNNGGTATSLTSSLTPSFVGQPVTFTATVTAQVGSIPDGETVTFNAGSTVLGTGLTMSGVATLTRGLPTAGIRLLTAVYGGDSSFLPSTSPSEKQVVNPDATQTSIASSQNPSIAGQPVTFTVTITAPYATVPDGETVTFKSGSTVLGTGPTASGVATFTTSFASTGHQFITASYPGDANFLTSASSALRQVTNANSTATVLSSSVNPSYLSEAVTFSATVTAAYGSIPDGETVTFKTGSTTLGTGMTAAGVATFTTSALPVTPGEKITASYPGDTTYPASKSTALTQVVTTAPTSVALTSSANPAQWPQSITFTAVVASPGPLPTGAVTFLNGTKALGTVNLDPTGTAMLTPPILDAATYTITAQYNGSSASAGSTSGPLSQVVIQAATATMLVTSENPANTGDTVTFTATATAGSGTPGGTVTFSINSTPVATMPLSGGVATYVTSALTTGQYTITATYNGSTDFGGSGASLTQNVN